MPPFWHPLSSLFFPDPHVPATPGLLRALLARGRPIELLYSGDRMFPTIQHGSLVTVMAPAGDPVRPGEIVLCCPGGAPDMLRLLRCRGGGFLFAGDADPAPPIEIPDEAILGRLVRDNPAATRRRLFSRRMVRLALDLREAIEESVASGNEGRDAADSVRVKYSEQAAGYDRTGGEAMEAALLGRVREHVRDGGRILVIGSGTGRECFGLERAGWRVTGVDFSAEMVRTARARASRLGFEATFIHTDVRDHAEPHGSLAAVLFTYDTYSFLPGRTGRVGLLRRMGSWLEPGGCIVLSARRSRGFQSRAILTLKFLSSGAGEWGDIHTRWIRPDARIGRAFVHHFTEDSLAVELADAGFGLLDWQGGHGLVLPAGHLYSRAG